jgi:hypothetical protein
MEDILTIRILGMGRLQKLKRRTQVKTGAARQ